MSRCAIAPNINLMEMRHLSVLLLALPLPHLPQTGPVADLQSTHMTAPNGGPLVEVGRNGSFIFPSTSASEQAATAGRTDLFAAEGYGRDEAAPGGGRCPHHYHGNDPNLDRMGTGPVPSSATCPQEISSNATTSTLGDELQQEESVAVAPPPGHAGYAPFASAHPDVHVSRD
jgi:hypothetical protein